MISIIIPVLNEEKFIASTINKCRNLEIDKEIIIIDNGSTDGTAEILNSLNSYNNFTILHEPQRGKGNAVRAGIKAAKGEFIALQDADDEYDPSHFREMLLAINKGYDIVYGVRVCSPFKMSLSSFVANKILLKLINLKKQKNNKISDIFTGQRLYRTEILKSFDVKSTKFNIETELTIKGLGLKHTDVNVSYTPRSHFEGKKICFTDFLHILWTYVSLNKTAKQL